MGDIFYSLIDINKCLHDRNESRIKKREVAKAETNK